MSDQENTLYRVLFIQQDEVYEIFSRYLSEESLMGFIELDELVFAEEKTVLDANEARVRKEFQDVKRCYIPMHAVLRVDEVEKPGFSKTHKLATVGKTNVSRFPQSSKATPAKDKD